jgi:WD40 repeat protein
MSGYAQGDLIITGGKDSKVKVWILAQLIAIGGHDQCFAEFGEHSAEVTCVRFSTGASLQRAFSCSLDKTFRVYDLPSKCTIKQI